MRPAIDRIGCHSHQMRSNCARLCTIHSTRAQWILAPSEKVCINCCKIETPGHQSLTATVSEDGDGVLSHLFRFRQFCAGGACRDLAPDCFGRCSQAGGPSVSVRHFGSKPAGDTHTKKLWNAVESGTPGADADPQRRHSLRMRNPHATKEHRSYMSVFFIDRSTKTYTQFTCKGR